MDMMNLISPGNTKLDVSQLDSDAMNDLSQYIESDEFSNLLQDKLQLNSEQLKQLQQSLSQLSDAIDGQTGQNALPLLQAIMADPQKLLEEGAMVLPIAIPEIANLIQDKLMASQGAESDETVTAIENEVALLPKTKQDTNSQPQSKTGQEELVLTKEQLQQQKQSHEMELDVNETFKTQTKVTQVPVDTTSMLNNLRKVVKQMPAGQNVAAVTYGEHIAQAVQAQTTTGVKQLQITQPVHDSGWRDAFAEKVLWMSNQNISAAKVQINPAELGPMEVMLKMNQHQASLVINATSAGVKESLEEAMPRLRELFEQQGMTLVETDISDSREQLGSNFTEDSQSADEPSGSTDNDHQDAPMQTSRMQRPQGLVDYFV